MKFEKDYAIIDGSYVKILFINSFSNHLTNGFLNTFLKAKGKMISTIHYKAADAEKVLSTIKGLFAKGIITVRPSFCW